MERAALVLCVVLGMHMTVAVYAAVYAGLRIFLLGCVRRIMQYARTPIHLRWELYPVPHEEAGRAAHGDSYFEETAWSTKLVLCAGSGARV